MIDVFISRPTILPTKYQQSYSKFETFLNQVGIKSRRLGSSDYSRKPPLIAVMDIIEDCKGAIILGYPQHEVHNTSKKAGSVLSESCLHISEPTRLGMISYAVFCLKKKKTKKNN